MYFASNAMQGGGLEIFSYAQPNDHKNLQSKNRILEKNLNVPQPEGFSNQKNN